MKISEIRVLLLVGFLLGACAAPAYALQEPSASGRAEALLRDKNPEEAIRILLQELKTLPGNYRTHHLLGLAFTQSSNFESAAGAFREALRLNPDFLPARKNLATVLWFSNRRAEAEREFLSVNKAAPADPVPHLYLGVLTHGRKQFEKAKSHFERAGDLALKNPEVLPAVLETYLAARDMSFPDQVVQQIGQAVTPNPELVFRCGTLFGRYGFYTQAVSVLEKIRATYPNRQELLLNLGTAQLQAKKYAAAVESLESLVESSPANMQALLLLGEACDAAGELDKAYRTYSRAIELDPLSEEGYIALSNFAAAHHNTEYALKTLARGLEKKPGSFKLQMQQGTLAALQGNLGQAEESFRLASQSDPQTGLPLLALGIVQMESGKPEIAAETLRLAARKSPGDYRPEYFYAFALAQAGGRTDPVRRKEIIASLRRAISLNPKEPEPRVALGQAYLADGQLELAALELETALKAAPGHQAALYQLSAVRRKQGKTDEARRLLSRFQEIKEKTTREEQTKTLVQIMKTVKEQ